MKSLLGALMCLVLTISQTWAISGGPFGRGGGIAVTGTYAGALTAIAQVIDPGPPPVTLPPDNSVAIFSMVVSPTGIHLGQVTNAVATGTIIIFRNGIVYTGYPASVLPASGNDAPGISGVVDPDNAKVRAVIAARMTTDPINDTHAIATGRFDTTRIVDVSGQAGLASARIRGNASITYRTSSGGDPNGDSGGPIPYHVRGFKQSDSI